MTDIEEIDDEDDEIKTDPRSSSKIIEDADGDSLLAMSVQRRSRSSTGIQRDEAAEKLIDKDTATFGINNSRMRNA